MHIFIVEFVDLWNESNKPEKGQGQNAVLDLLNHLSAAYGITTDYFFTCIELANTPLDKNITLCGTLRNIKPYFPTELLPARHRKEFLSKFAFKEDKSSVSIYERKMQ